MSETTSETTPEIDFRLFDADNHYYEAPDAFIRHIEPRFAKRAMQWADIDGKRRLLVGGRVNRFIPNPLFDPVARPGVLDAYFRGRSPADDIRGAFGDLEPIRPEYRSPAARLEVLDRQGIEAAFLFPTLGVGMEEALTHDPDACHAAFRAFNRWLAEDWGFAYEGRLYAAPMITLLDPDQAADEVEWAIGQGARVVVMRSAPVVGPGFARSPGDAVYDPFWARIDEAGILAAYHSGDSGYGRYALDWGETDEMEAFRRSAFKAVTSTDRPVFDTLAALVCHGVLHRFPNVRVATIESGSEWAPLLLRKLGKAYKQTPGAFSGGESPISAFKRQVWVAPYYEDDIRGLADAIGADHVLFGSDWPHAEGLAEPATFVDDLEGFSDDEVRLIMRENGLGLATPRPRVTAPA
jgi:predicted TIM-barrel fold metal-dependent hydrolase